MPLVTLSGLHAACFTSAVFSYTHKCCVSYLILESKTTLDILLVTVNVHILIVYANAVIMHGYPCRNLLMLLLNHH